MITTQEPFNPNEFIERLAWTAMGVPPSSGDDFASGLLNTFEEAIK